MIFLQVAQAKDILDTSPREVTILGIFIIAIFYLIWDRVRLLKRLKKKEDEHTEAIKELNKVLVKSLEVSGEAKERIIREVLEMGARTNLTLERLSNQLTLSTLKDDLNRKN